MTRHELELAVEWWRRRLGLERWAIRVEWEPDDDGDDERRPHASTWRARDYDEARIRFNLAEYRGWDRRRGNVLVVHELLHLVTRDVEHVLDLTDGQIHRDSHELLVRAHRHAVEGAVDRLAYRLVELVEDLGELPPAARRRRARDTGTDAVARS